MRKIVRMSPTPEVIDTYDRKMRAATSGATVDKATRKAPKRVAKEPAEQQLNSLQKRAKAEKAKPKNGAKEPSAPTARAVPRTVEGYVTLAQLAEEKNIQAQLARLWVVKAELKKPTEGWRWKTGSRELARVRKVMELD